MLVYTPTPVQEIHDEMLHRAGVRLLVKREDLNHPHISGNKWWKIFHNLTEAQRLGKTTLLTFGGAFSNHIYAAAAAGRELGLRTIGLIRGEETSPLNATLRFATAQGMRLVYVSRDRYRDKNSPAFEAEIYAKYGDVYVMPEGGTNALAVKGCEDFAREIQSDVDQVWLPVGTGGTMAGLVRGIDAAKRVVGVGVLRGNFLVEEVRRWVDRPAVANWSILTNYHHGGYAKTTPELLTFIRDFEMRHHLPLDHVYTGKMMWAIMQEVQRGAVPRGTTLLAIHTGGLQGRLPES